MGASGTTSGRSTPTGGDGLLKVHGHEARRYEITRDAVVAIFDTRNQAYDAAREIELEADIVDVKSGAQGG
jgi:hypothetical protein